MNGCSLYDTCVMRAGRDEIECGHVIPVRGCHKKKEKRKSKFAQSAGKSVLQQKVPDATQRAGTHSRTRVLSFSLSLFLSFSLSLFLSFSLSLFLSFSPSLHPSSTPVLRYSVLRYSVLQYSGTQYSGTQNSSTPVLVRVNA